MTWNLLDWLDEPRPADTEFEGKPVVAGPCYSTLPPRVHTDGPCCTPRSTPERDKEAGD